MRSRIILLLLVVLAAGWWLWSSETGRMLTGRWTFTEKVVVDRGTYFRLKVDFAYKGEPQHFDIVVGCNVVNIRYKDSSSTYEAGLIPTVYGRRMSDGKAVVVRPPDACRGDTTANGGVPENFLPVMIVYDDADTLAFGTGYMTDDAYDNPRSLMKFGKATIEKATRVEFDAFRENGPPNIVSRGQYHSVQSPEHMRSLGLKKVHPAFGWHCYAYSRWRLTEAERELARKYWPGDKPEYWIPADNQARSAFSREHSALLSKRPVRRTRDDGLVLSGVDLDDFSPDTGAARREGVQEVGLDSKVKAPSLYPVDTDMREDKWPEPLEERIERLDTLTDINVANIEVAGTHTRGFAYCYRAELPPRGHPYMDKLKSRSGAVTVDGDPVDEAASFLYAGGSNSSFILQNDEYIFQRMIFYLETARGDV